MIRTLLEGKKTQTRRVLKPKRGVTLADYTVNAGEVGIGRRLELPADKLAIPYAVGDRLWVREGFAWMPHTAYGLPKAVDPNDADMAIYYRADFDRSGKPQWRSPFHLPRWASRLTLTVTEVRVQRLQEISRPDAIAEGMNGAAENDAICDYSELWDSLNAERDGGAYVWNRNPWVVAASFSIEHRNIDRPAHD